MCQWWIISRDSLFQFPSEQLCSLFQVVLLEGFLHHRSNCAITPLFRGSLHPARKSRTNLSLAFLPQKRPLWLPEQCETTRSFRSGHLWKQWHAAPSLGLCGKTQFAHVSCRSSCPPPDSPRGPDPLAWARAYWYCAEGAALHHKVFAFFVEQPSDLSKMTSTEVLWVGENKQINKKRIMGDRTNK